MTLTVLTVIKRAMRLHGALASGDDPGANDAADFLLALNTVKRAMFGTVIGPRLSPQAVSGTTGQAERGGEYQVNVPATFALSAPASPRPGSRFGVADAGFSFGANNCTVTGNGQRINAAASYVMNVNGQTARFWFRGDTGNWVLEADYAGLTDVIEFPDPLAAYLPYLLALAVAPEIGADVTPVIAAGAAEGRQAFARAYASRGANVTDPVIGLAQAAAAQG